MKKQDDSLAFVVGEERKLPDLLCEGEVLPLLDGVIRAGAGRAEIRAAGGEILWGRGEKDPAGQVVFDQPLTLEGEEIGRTMVSGPEGRKAYLQGIAALFHDALQTILMNNLKRMLTTEIHTSVVNLSYDELLASNKRLAASEARYRELAENLEIKVAERTMELKRAHAGLLQQEKMAAIGQLAAGVAHEINNPLGFVSSNLNTLARYVERFREMLDFYRTGPAAAGVAKEFRDQAEALWRKRKLDFILADMKDLFSQSLEGCRRVRKIVADLKSFSHIDDPETGPVDLNAEIERTLNVLGHQIPADAVIKKEFGALPPFVCNPALLCQVFLNIIVNAVQARSAGLELRIETRREGAWILILFADNGPGIPAEALARVFEPFYTTREVGEGTGMGLATAYEIVTSCGGALEVESPPGRGARFLVRLPTGEV